jgi:TPR repeat protein
MVAFWRRRKKSSGVNLNDSGDLQDMIGSMFQFGVTINKRTAAEFYKLAAEKGKPEAQLALGVLHFNGDGIPVNKDEAAKWIKKAAQQGHELAIQFLCRETLAGLAKNELGETLLGRKKE